MYLVHILNYRMEVLLCTVLFHYCWDLSPAKAVTLTGDAVSAEAENAAVE